MRYYVSQDLWLLLRLRKINLSQTARVVGMSPQMMQRVRSSPRATISEDAARRLCEWLDIRLRDYFMPAPSKAEMDRHHDREPEVVEIPAGC